ncbi:MAG: epoxyqueuosine reductase QueH [Alphaproteobacteria bacterium]|nr:epoxyqueuosine reductase QueH [Alphaproteobacteria bacterium]
MLGKLPKISLPDGEKRLLLLSCCAPCSGGVITRLCDSNVDFTVLFYNPNIHPKKEYELRKQENKMFAEKKGVAFVALDYDCDNWFERIKGLENEPERGKRCSACFSMRLEKTALYAVQNGFSLFSSVLGISRYKDINQVNECGIKAASKHDGLTYWTFNWRKNNGSQFMDKISRDEKFYRQKYCGCIL